MNNRTLEQHDSRLERQCKKNNTKAALIYVPNIIKIIYK